MQANEVNKNCLVVLYHVERLPCLVSPIILWVLAGILTHNMKLLFGNLTFIERNTVARNKCFEICGGGELVKEGTPAPECASSVFSKHLPATLQLCPRTNDSPFRGVL